MDKKQVFIDGFRYGIVYVCREVLGTDYPIRGWNSKDQDVAELAWKEYLEQED